MKYPLIAKFILIIFLMFASYKRNAVWQDNIALWEDAAGKSSSVKERIHINLGVAYLKKGLFSRAIKYFSEVLEINPNLIDAHTNLGMAFKLIGDRDTAIEQYQSALRLAPGSAKTHNNLGLAYGSQGRIDDAAFHFTKAIKLEADYVDAHFNLGLLYLQMEDSVKARTQFVTVLRLNRHDSQAKEFLNQLNFQ